MAGKGVHAQSLPIFRRVAPLGHYVIQWGTIALRQSLAPYDNALPAPPAPSNTRQI